MNTARE